MTVRPLPAWVIDRMAIPMGSALYRRGRRLSLPDLWAAAEAAKAELLAIIEERAPGWQIHYKRDGRDEYLSLAELLEDRDVD